MVIYQGSLLKKRKNLGFKKYWVVLNNGELIYYRDEKDADKDEHRKGTYNLNNAMVKEYHNKGPRSYLTYSFTIIYSDGKRHTLCSLASSKNKGIVKKSINNLTEMIKCESSKINGRLLYNSAERKKNWVKALKENIELSDLNMEILEKENLNIIPTIEDLQNQIMILKKDENRLTFMIAHIEKDLAGLSDSDLENIARHSNLYKIITEYKANFSNLKLQTQSLIEDTKKCLQLRTENDLLLESQLANANEKNVILSRNVREAAQNNFDLEKKELKQLKDEVDELSSLSSMSDTDESQLEEYFDTAQSFEIYRVQKSIKRMAKTFKSNANYSKPNEPSNDSEFDELGWRLRLPAKQLDRSQIGIWTILKHFIGKELTKITMPVFLCEPLTFLQRISENTEYSYLLNKAVESPDPCKRIEFIAAFAASPCCSIERLSKPFNPVLGETFELVRENAGFRIVAEQVSHHPPVSAFHADSTNSSKHWRYYGNVQPKIKFWGKSVEVLTQGLLTVELPGLNETYTWRPIPCTVHNIIVGTMWFEFSGILEVICHQTGYKAILNFHAYTGSHRQKHRVDGYIYDNKKIKINAMYGFWPHFFYSCSADSYEKYLKDNKKTSSDQSSNSKADSQNKSENQTSKINEPSLDVLIKESNEVWTVFPRPPNATQYYNFSYFTMSLNQMKPEYENLIAPTDSRFRSDLRQLELGNLDAAGQEKNRIEEKQREARKNKEEYKGKWFSLGQHPEIGEQLWIFTNRYWLRDYKDCPSLF